ncbi:MAG: YraN family protein, partial [Betaproteobacteria bacterium]|nr:YraN family protein [Betaproteobacteria bacterium]
MTAERHTVAPSRAEAGTRAEALAAEFLTARGVTIVERNFRTRFGEIDLIGRDGDTLVFVEVRLRRRNDYGGAAGSVTYAKRARLKAAARGYLSRLRRDPPCRFDALLLDALDPPRIEWVRDAFSE